MKADSPSAAMPPLLVGRFRVDDELAGGDIVIMWTRHEGADRMKIFQRTQQNPVSRTLHLFYDWVSGNINCTELIESRTVENAEDDNNALINLSAEPNTMRHSLERSMRPIMSDNKSTNELLKELSTLHIKSLDGVKSFELSEAAMNRDTLLARTQDYFPMLSEDDMGWLRGVLDNPNKVSPPASPESLDALFRRPKENRAIGFDISNILEQTRIVRHWHRHLASLQLRSAPS